VIECGAKAIVVHYAKYRLQEIGQNLNRVVDCLLPGGGVMKLDRVAGSRPRDCGWSRTTDCTSRV
jgi:hypothetical protein